MSKNEIRPMHPGEILREEYLDPLSISVNALRRFERKYLHIKPDRTQGARKYSSNSGLKTSGSSKCGKWPAWSITINLA